MELVKYNNTNVVAQLNRDALDASSNVYERVCSLVSKTSISLLLPRDGSLAFAMLGFISTCLGRRLIFCANISLLLQEKKYSCSKKPVKFDDLGMMIFLTPINIFIFISLLSTGIL